MSDAGAGLFHAICLLEDCLREFFCSNVEDFFLYWRDPGREAPHIEQVVLIDKRISRESHENWWNEKELFQLVCHDGVEHHFHRELRKHGDFGIDEDWEVEGVNEASDLKLSA